MEPLAQAGAGAQASGSDWSVLKSAAVSGELMFEPAAAEQCARVCEDAIAKIEQHLRQADRLSRVAGFGTPAEGVQLAGKFTAKADEAVAVLKAHRQVLMEMRDTYRAAGKAYASTEAANSSGFGATR